MEIDRKKYKILNGKSKEVIHWKINPLMAISELVHGHRVPKVFLIDKTSDRPLLERGYVPCPHCGTVHDGRTWSKQNDTVYENWYGYYCPSCQEIIPCIRNWTAQVLLWLSWPFRKNQVARRKRDWLALQPARFQNLTFDPVKVNWTKMGLKWGFLMTLVMGIGFPLILPMFDDALDYDQVLDIQFMLLMISFSLPIFLLGGLLFGFLMRRSMEKGGVSSNVSGNTHKN